MVNTSSSGDNFCLCKGEDDGTPMVMCDSCHNWFHFRCISLKERDAEDIYQYVCQSCHESTGNATILNWQRETPPTDFNSSTSWKHTTTPKLEDPPDIPSSSEDGADSSGEFVDETQNKTGPARSGRAVRRISDSDESRSPSPASHRNLRSTDRNALKRKASSLQSATKRKKSISKPKTRAAHSDDEAPVLSDPVRKYCLGKLQAVIEPIFLEYRKDSGSPDQPAKDAAALYVARLEKAIYDTYCEPDKNGKDAPGGKYKERFRMLSFNLDQKDRTKLRQRIAENTLAPAELSQMSSADLANEQTKQQIEAADEESLKHSILQVRPTHPRAKITHKGEEIIEDISGEEERRRIREAEDRERERVRITTMGPGRGGQPPLEQKPVKPTLSIVPTANPLDSPTTSTFNIADITMDSPIQSTFPLHSPTVSSPSRTVTELRAAHSPTRSSFNLSTLWSGQPKDSDVVSTVETSAPEPALSEPIVGAMDLDFDETVANDQDFDMFLENLNEEPTINPKTERELEQRPQKPPVERSSPPTPPPPSAEQIAFENLPCVWNGKIVMPDDPRPAIVCSVVARQISGKFNPSGAQWSTLFPSNPAQVDGRVPTEKSTKYLVTTRLNAAKELLAVAFTPAPESEMQFNAMFQYLVTKNRHALIFPWGLQPLPTAPGKEFYIIPLAAGEAVPEYIQLLDQVLLPSIRTSNVLLGVFVLQKGRITPPPPPPPPIIPQHPSLTPAQLPALLQSISLPLAISSLAQLPSAAQAVDAPLVNVTQEQMELILRGLSKTKTNAAPPSFMPAPSPVPITPQYHQFPYPTPHNTGAPLAPSPPQTHSAGPGPSYPHATRQTNIASSRTRGGRRDFSPPHQHRDDRGSRYTQDERTRDRDRNERGGRGRPRNASADFGRPIDSGWAGRGRGRGRGRGSAAPNSPPSNPSPSWLQSAPSRSDTGQASTSWGTYPSSTQASWAPPIQRDPARSQPQQQTEGNWPSR